MPEEIIQLGFDKPLQTGQALKDDKLGRRGFADSVVKSLMQVTSSAGFVVSVEGPWGSGKTSTLAMIEELLKERSEESRPIIVHFNPWLVGERDALLGQFLAKLSSAVQLTEHAKNGKKAAKELKAYANVFDVVKLIPGAEPWASIVKSVIKAMGDAAGDIAEYKTPDIELHKRRVEEALTRFPNPIVVFIDDIDRLFPAEVFEMIRIIKAVGDLPNVGYVLAWDSSYVSSALSSALVPQSDSYLDKIVQVRMPLPGMSLDARSTLINEALNALQPSALESHFPNDEDRLTSLYFSGLRELLEHPRDVTRVFNTVAVIEPALRGEVVFSDIVGFAALMVKTPSIFDLLRKNPNSFVGSRSGESRLLDEKKEVIQREKANLELAYEKCSMPEAARQIVHHLFPKIAKTDDSFAYGQISDIEGHIAAPSRLLVALQLSISGGDVSYTAAKRYLLIPSARGEIVKVLTQQNCLEFMESVGDMAKASGGKGITDLELLCLSIAQLADVEPFSARSRDRSKVFNFPAERVAIRAIDELVKAVDPSLGSRVATNLVENEQCLTVAMEILLASYGAKNDDEKLLICLKKDKARLERKFSENVLLTASDGIFFKTCNPGFILWNMAKISPAKCKQAFTAFKRLDPTLDSFALEILRNSFDSHKGQIYALPKDKATLEAFCSLTSFRNHAKKRLRDNSVTFPVRAAWQAVVDEKKYYGKDGSDSRM